MSKVNLLNGIQYYFDSWAVLFTLKDKIQVAGVIAGKTVVAVM